MTSYPDFREHGYQILQELGRNREGGRITWLALDVKTKQQVVLKQFCFAQFGSSWSGFEAHQREIQILQGLAHPGIPKYMGSFATSDGFCLVQEYINAPSLAEARKFAPAEIKQIAINALEILVYLQNLQPPVIHRDIKPENILVDEALNVYLIDFGFARIDSGEVAGSSVFKGTPGFIPPEQMFKPSKATDLYALGTTLICLLTGIKSTNIYQLQHEDDPYLIKFQHLLPQLSLRFLGWLEKMVQPLQKNRFTNAQTALTALKPLDVIRVPEVDFSGEILEFKADKLGEKLTQNIKLTNTIPDTLLQGRWEVAPHPNDPPHTPDSHPWISVTPDEFKGNAHLCQIKVDTSKLIADKQYKRQLILHSNAYPENHTLTVKVQTAALPIEKVAIPYAWIVGVLLISIVASISMTWFISTVSLSNLIEAVFHTVFGAVMGGLFGVGLMGNVYEKEPKQVDDESFLIVLTLFSGIGAIAWPPLSGMSDLNVLVLAGISIWMIIVLPCVIGILRLCSNMFKFVVLLLTIQLGIHFGIMCIVGFAIPHSLFLLAVTGIPLVTMLLYPPIKRSKLIAKYRQSEEYLIKP